MAIAENIHYLKMLRLLKVLKLLRITRMAKAIRQWEEVLDFQYNITISEYSLKMIKLAFIIFSVIHMNACILFFVPSFMEFPGHFSKNRNGIDSKIIKKNWYKSEKGVRDQKWFLRFCQNYLKNAEFFRNWTVGILKPKCTAPSGVFCVQISRNDNYNWFKFQS